MDPKAISEQINKSWLLRLCYSRTPGEVCYYAIPLMLLMFGVGIYGTRNLWLCLGLFAIGPIYWSAIEYVVHRFFFHWTPKSEKLYAAIYRIHKHHHDLPNDYTILNAGPFFGIPMAALWYGITALLVGSFWIAAPLVGGAVLGYLFYEWVHYEAHAGSHKAGWMGYLKRYHLTHHFIAHGACFGVTSPLWDKVFRTELKPKRSSEKSAISA